MTKILLVEDDNSLREIYGVRLLAEGYSVVSADDGEKALALAISEKPDLIVSDVMMPRISGFEMLDLLRGNESTKNVKVIMLTALSSEHQRERGDELGADRYLVKSQVGIEDIVRTVHEVLNDQSSQRTVEQMETSARAAHDAQINAQKSQEQGSVVVNQPNDTNLPASGQSSFNPLAATSPNVVAGKPLPNLPNTPLQVPAYNQPPVRDSAAYYQGSPTLYGNEQQSNTSANNSVTKQPATAITLNAQLAQRHILNDQLPRPAVKSAPIANKPAQSLAPVPAPAITAQPQTQSQVPASAPVAPAPATPAPIATTAPVESSSITDSIQQAHSLQSIFGQPQVEPEPQPQVQTQPSPTPVAVEPKPAAMEPSPLPAPVPTPAASTSAPAPAPAPAILPDAESGLPQQLPSTIQPQETPVSSVADPRINLATLLGETNNLGGVDATSTASAPTISTNFFPQQ